MMALIFLFPAHATVDAEWLAGNPVGLRMDLPTAVAALMSVSLSLVFISWIFYNLRGQKELDFQTPYMQQCPYCSYIFFDYHQEKVLHCPRCESLFNADFKKSGAPEKDTQDESRKKSTE